MRQAEFGQGPLASNAVPALPGAGQIKGQMRTLVATRYLISLVSRTVLRCLSAMLVLSFLMRCAAKSTLVSTLRSCSSGVASRASTCCKEQVTLVRAHSTKCIDMLTNMHSDQSNFRQTC